MDKHQAKKIKAYDRVLLTGKDWAQIRGGPTELSTVEKDGVLIVFQVKTDRSETKLVTHLEIERYLDNEEVSFWLNSEIAANYVDGE